MLRLSFNSRRAIVGVALALTLFCLINYYLGFGLFGSLDKKVLIASFGVLGFCILYIGPTMGELREYRDRRRGSR
jgi:hypothetical protein